MDIMVFFNFTDNCNSDSTENPFLLLFEIFEICNKKDCKV